MRRMLSPVLAASLMAALLSPSVAMAASHSIANAHRSRAIQPAALRARPVITGLNNPSAFTFTARGRIFYGERGTGKIRVFDPTTRRNRLFFDIPKVVNGPATGTEQGLLGIALAPRYPKNPFVYAYATRSVPGGQRDQILRIRSTHGHGSNMAVIFSSRTVSGRYHDGGRILFGPDGMLWAIQGEAHSSANAQNLTNSAGKILRMTPAGKAAPGNPFIHSATRDRRIWAFGIRNSFGFDFDPRTGRLWETENGPQCNDELNRIVKGRNFGWGPNETCSGTSPFDTNNSGPPPRIMPKRWYSPTIAPTGLVFCRKCWLGRQNRGKLYFGDFNTGRIHRVVLTANRLGVASQSVVYRRGGGILSMEAGPTGALYFSTSGGIFRLRP